MAGGGCPSQLVLRVACHAWPGFAGQACERRSTLGIAKKWVAQPTRGRPSLNRWAPRQEAPPFALNPEAHAHPHAPLSPRSKRNETPARCCVRCVSLKAGPRMSPDPVSIRHRPPRHSRTVQQRAEISDTDRPENAAPGPRNCGVGNRQAIRGSRPRSAKHPIRGCLRRCLAPNSRVRASVSCRRAGVSDRSDNSPEPNRPRFRPYPSGRTTGRVVRSRVSRAKLG
jgi:hypothetical protein